MSTPPSGYVLPDGSPRYGARSEGPLPAPVPVRPPLGSPGALVAEALDFDMAQLAAAADLRASCAWADTRDPLLETWRRQHPEEFLKATLLVVETLGPGPVGWRMTAAEKRSEALQPILARRKAAGTGLGIRRMNMLIRVLILAVPLAMIAGSAAEPAVLLVMVMFYLLASGPLRRHSSASRRLPSAGKVSSLALREILDDLKDAVLLGILLEKGTEVDPAVQRSAERGWRHVRHAAAGLETIRRGPA